MGHAAGLWNGGALLRTKLAHVFAVWCSSAARFCYTSHELWRALLTMAERPAPPFLYALANSKRSLAPLASTACKAKPGLFTFCRVCNRSAAGNLMKVYLLGS